MSEVFHVSGVPGAGKTTWLAAQARRWGSEFGFGHIIACSYTRTAAAEIAARDLPLRKDQVGTLHGFAFRALGLVGDDVAESHMDEFNEAFPGYKLSGEALDADEPEAITKASEADNAFANVEILRARMTPLDEWGPHERNFYDNWSRWRDESGYTDFTGFIERALEHCPVAPGNPSAALWDEQQDSSLLELALIDRWSQKMDKTLLAFDSDQALYAWRGADPDGLVEASLALDVEHRRYLTQSYRLPEQVNTIAMHWISRLTHREPKVSLPRVLDDGSVVAGTVRRLGKQTNYAKPEALVADIWEQVEAGRSVMVLGACNYMLTSIMAECRKQAVPYSTLVPKRVGGYGQSSSAKRTTAIDRLLAFLRPQREAWGDDARWYTWDDVALWTEAMRADGLLKHGAKARVQRAAPQVEAPYWELMDNVFDLDEDEIEAVDAGDLDFFEAHLLARRESAFRFPLSIARKRGAALLREEPRLTLSTIHGAKGRQADVVYLLPDISKAGATEWGIGGARKEAVVRQFYVALTRAREELVFVDEVGPYFLSREMFLRPVSS